MSEDRSLNDLYEKVGKLTGQAAMIQDDVKTIKDQMQSLNGTVAKWSGGLAVVATVAVNLAKELIPWK